MATVADLTAPYGNFMLSPRLGPGVCGVCFNVTDGYGRCYACAHGGRWLDVVTPISYSVAGEQLHHALVSYKRWRRPLADRFCLELAAVLWRFLDGHEPCVSKAAGVERFPLVTTVPSGDPGRDDEHPLHRLVGELVGPTRERHRRLLTPPQQPVTPHEFSPSRYAPTTSLDGEPILLIDDTWTTGASAQSAAATLKRAGSGGVAVVVIGRYLNRPWGRNHDHINGLPKPFDWGQCAICGRQ